MNDAAYALSVAYAGLLSGLTYNSLPVAIYELMAPDNAVAPYVVVGPWVARSANTKYTFGQEGQLQIDVITRQIGNARSRKTATEIANTITALIKPSPSAEVLEAPGFRVWNTRIGAVSDVPNPVKTDLIVRKMITVLHTLTQA